MNAALRGMNAWDPSSNDSVDLCFQCQPRNSHTIKRAVGETPVMRSKHGSVPFSLVDEVIFMQFDHSTSSDSSHLTHISMSHFLYIPANMSLSWLKPSYTHMLS